MVIGARWAGSFGWAGGFGWAVGPRPALGAHPSGVTGQPPGVGQRAAQQELDLGVGAAQLVVRPPGQCVMHRWIQPQQYTLTFTHRHTTPAVTDTGSRC